MLFSFLCRCVHTFSVCGVRNALKPRPVYGVFCNLFHSVYIRKVRACVQPHSQHPIQLSSLMGGKPWVYPHSTLPSFCRLWWESLRRWLTSMNELQLCIPPLEFLWEMSLGAQSLHREPEAYCEHCTCTKPGTTAHDDVIFIFSPLQ